MDRRSFLTKGWILSGVTLGGVAGLFPRGNWASRGLNGDFSIDVVTDHPDRAIRLIEQIIHETSPGARTVKFSEHRLPGGHVGDIAFVRNRHLVDFRRADDETSRRLRQTAAALSMPKRVDNPTLLRFCAEGRAVTPTDARVFYGDTLVKQLPLDRATDAHRIDGEKGHIELAVDNRSVRVVSASCKHRTCMEMGAISRPGQSLVCIPNRITVAISGTNSLGVDGVTF